MSGQVISKGRLEAFSDGVIAIIITIMVLELKVPHGTSFMDLLTIVPVLLSYVLSFVYVGIYWNNHHHLLQAAKGVSGPILWANLHLLFWMSLVPFVTSWIGETGDAVAPVACYGVILLMTASAYQLLATMLARHDGPGSRLAIAIGNDRKGRMSMLLYAGGIVTSFIWPDAGIVIYVAVALMWFIPDRRVERVLSNELR